MRDRVGGWVSDHRGHGEERLSSFRVRRTRGARSCVAKTFRTEGVRAFCQKLSHDVGDERALHGDSFLHVRERQDALQWRALAEKEALRQRGQFAATRHAPGLAAAATTPMDVIKTRMQTQCVLLDCDVAKTVETTYNSVCTVRGPRAENVARRAQAANARFAPDRWHLPALSPSRAPSFARKVSWRLPRAWVRASSSTFPPPPSAGRRDEAAGRANRPGGGDDHDGAELLLRPPPPPNSTLGIRLATHAANHSIDSHFFRHPFPSLVRAPSVRAGRMSGWFSGPFESLVTSTPHSSTRRRPSDRPWTLAATPCEESRAPRARANVDLERSRRRHGDERARCPVARERLVDARPGQRRRRRAAPEKPPAFEKPKPKRAVRASAAGTRSARDERGTGRRPNTVPEENETALSSRAHLARMMRDGTSFVEHGVGGLDKQFANIFRRVFASRMVDANIKQKERLNLQHVRGGTCCCTDRRGRGRRSWRDSSGTC